jgi:predicted dehydrogenase
MVCVALPGSGRWGPNFLRTLVAQPARRVTWLREPQPGHLTAAASSCPGARSSSEAEAVFSTANVDDVMLATSTSTHAARVVRVLKARGRSMACLGTEEAV